MIARLLVLVPMHWLVAANIIALFLDVVGKVQWYWAIPNAAFLLLQALAPVE